MIPSKVCLFLLFYWLSLIPIPYFSGLYLFSFILDNGIIGFHLLIVLLYPIIYLVNVFESKTIKVVLCTLFIVLLLLVGFNFNWILLFLVVYEFLALVLFLILILFMFSYYRIRISFYYYFISIIGNLFLICALILTTISCFFIVLLFIIPFLIKIPSFLFIIDYLKFIVKPILVYH